MMERKIWLPVRCCCTPTKIFGFLQVPAHAARVNEISIGEHRIEIKDFVDGRVAMPSYGEYLRAEPLPEYSPRTERAVYSDDRPLEFWRSMPGFMEAACA